MKCVSCENDNREGRKFCSACGVRLAVLCDACGTPNEVGEAFCGECGGSLAPLAPQANTETSRTERSPAAYTPKHLADKILQSKSALEGERKQVTVMFADVKGSMELAEQLDPEEWHQILDRFFAILTDGVHRFEGTVNQYTGDGIMALFGAPIAHEDHAQRACYSALHIRDQIAAYATEVKREHGIGFSTRMGLNSGEVVVGAIGDDLRMDYTAQGHTVGLAQRMESLAEPNTCFMTAATASLVGGYFDLQDFGEFRVKGVTNPVVVHRLDGTGSSRTRFDVARARGLSRFVGRAADMRTLDDALEHTDAGNGQVIGVVADAGTGKSRLCFEFLERCRARGMKVYEGRAVAHGRNIPFLPILEVFRSYFGITLEDDDRSAREKIAGRMVLLDQRFADTLPLLFDFLGVTDPQRTAPKIDPDARQRQLIGVMRQLIHSVNEAQPTVTMIEDLHWLDDASREFIEHMVDAREGTRNLLLLNFRPEYRAEWMEKSWYRQIPLTPLGRDAIAELLADLLGTDPSLSVLATPIHKRTGGNPFFTEEVAQTLIESGHLEGDRGAYKLVTPVERLEVPATVQAILAARIDRLPEREKRLLQIASVIEKDFPEPLLAAVAELPKDDLKESLAALCKAEFIYELSIYPILEYSFKHPLTQEVALGSQLKDRRRNVHAAVARAIEEQDAGHLDERAALLAHHYEEAGEALLAARWHKRAAEWVAGTDASATTRHWQRVRALLREFPSNPEAATLGIVACRQLLNFGWRVGTGAEESLALFEEGKHFADALGDRCAHLYLSMVYTRSLMANGDVAQYVQSAIENRQTALEIDDVGLQANAWVYHVDALQWVGRFAESIQLAEEGLARFPRHLPPEDWAMGISPSTGFSFWRAIGLNWTGRLREGFEQLDRACRYAEEDGTIEMTAYIATWSTQSLYYANEPVRALAAAQKAAELSRSLGESPALTAHCNFAFAYAHLAADRATDAIEPARTALAMFRSVEVQHSGMAAVVLAEALLGAGQLSDAETAAREAITICRRMLRANLEAHAHGVFARTLLRINGASAREAVEAELAEAAALIERTGARILSPALLEWRAELASVLGDNPTSEQFLRQAVDGYKEIGAPKHAERLSKELDS